MALNTYVPGQDEPTDGWLVSDWDQASSPTEWQADNVYYDRGLTFLQLDVEAIRTPDSNSFAGAEIQSSLTAATGTWTWHAKAPEMVPGTVFGMFLFQADWQSQRLEFDMEIVGDDPTTIELVVHMAMADGRIETAVRYVELGFDPSADFHLYEISLDGDSATFRIDGSVVATFDKEDFEGYWRTGEVRSFTNLWATEAEGWAGTIDPATLPIRAEVLEAGWSPEVVQAECWKGTTGADVHRGTALNDTFSGSDGADQIYGEAGSDQIYGEAGSDSLYGWTGADRIHGGSGHDKLYGEGGHDLLHGESGNDVLYGGSGNDLLYGTGGGDILEGGAGSDWLEGGEDGDTLYGGNGADRLDGGMANDRLYGGLGNDVYILATSGDTVVEAVGAGTDTVRAGYSYVLGANLENLVLTGTAALNGTGNGLANRTTGNSGANTLSGLDGDDTLMGGAGNDRLDGGAGVDRLEGGAGIDRLQGGASVDTVTGGLANDTFVFAAPREAGDILTDFRNVSSDNDLFHISAAAFGGGLVGGRQLATSQFQIANDNVLQGSAEAGIRFIFEADATKLWFDSNGSAAGGLKLVADLQAGATMTAADIWLI